MELIIPIRGLAVPEDHGKETLNPTNQYQFDKVGILTLSQDVFDLGHPYL